MNVSPTTIQLFSGGFFDYKDMLPEAIHIGDIAHALSMQCRFNGHVDKFYSVAQHSVLVSHHVKPEKAFIGLMHDATEAYTGDMAKPLKNIMPEFEAFEDDVWAVIAEKYDLPYEMPEEIHTIDKAACLKEAMDLMGVGKDDWSWGIEPLDCGPIHAWCPELAKMMFLNRYHELSARRAA